MNNARQHANYPRQPGPHFNPANRGGNRREYGHQSADAYHSQRDPATQNHPMAQPRHQQSFSQDRPRSQDNAENWRQRPQQLQQQQGPRGQGRQFQGQLYQPGEDQVKAQAAMLEKLGLAILADAEISMEDLQEKEGFRMRLEQVCREVLSDHEYAVHGIRIPPQSVALKCFGSMASGFATKASDMDLALVSPYSTVQPEAPGSPIPRLLEKVFLEVGIGARLLTRTRVPIIKICEYPPENLRADLIEARLKWEAGEPEDMDGADEEQADELLPVAEDEEHQQKSTTLSATNAKSVHSAEDHQQLKQDPGTTDKSSDVAQKLSNLRQGDKQTFNSYCGKAKQAMRKLQLADLTHSNIATYVAEAQKKLDNFCLSFVRGLAEQELKKRLFSYYSLSEARNRTLAGVMDQAEGEKLAMAWENRPLPEKNERQEHFAQQILAAWAAIQNKETFHLDPLGYQKELHFGLERLKSIPSLQLLEFQQALYESPAAYHARAIKAMVELGGVDSGSPPNRVLPVILNRYIAGINNEEIRAGVQDFAATGAPRTLRAIARRHKSLQLAHDFQNALSKGYYQGPDEDIVRRYITYLLNPMIECSQSAEEYFDFVVPKTTTLNTEILPIIHRLANPANLAANQPRDPFRDRLEFPKTGTGVQCDINFSAHLALHNTALLRCYSYTDPRVKPLVLFVKHWAKVRGINNSYRGTLSSYGYVLMVLHYLVNVVRPFVCPNLQLLTPPLDPSLPPQEDVTHCRGADIKFWRDEDELQRLAAQNLLTQNRDSLGHLLRGFFEYYAHGGSMSAYPAVRCFDWGRDILSLRTHGGLLSKAQKGWTGAKTVTEVKTVAAPPSQVPSSPSATSVPGAVQEVKEVRHRYLFAIEDPFEVDHNVARTVTHNGIVGIRDEFRRAWRIIKAAGRGEEDLLQDVALAEKERNRGSFEQLLVEIHGDKVFDD